MSRTDIASPRLAGSGAAALAVSALALSLAACGGSGNAASASATQAGPMLGATFRGTIYVATQTSHVIKAFTDRVADVASCAAFAKTGDADRIFKVPSPQAPEPQVDIEVADFHGPGTYTPAMLRRDRQDSILLTGKSGTSQYVITSPLANRTPGKEVLFLQKNGSGELVYSNAHLNGQAGNPEVAGVIEWSCSS
jgi:hypothetical protein